MSTIVTDTTEFLGTEYITRYIPDPENEGMSILIAEDRLGKRLWDSNKSRYNEPEPQCRNKDEHINGYLPIQDLLTMSDEQVFHELY